MTDSPTSRSTEQRKASYYLYTQEAALLHLAEGAAFSSGATLELQLEVTQLDYPHGSAIRQDVVSVRHDFYEWVHHARISIAAWRARPPSAS